MRRLLSPRWVILHLAALALVLVFVRLGFWQLDRLEERRTDNEMGQAHFAGAAVPLEELSGDPDALVYTRVTATGTFDAGHEVLIRSQLYLDTAGFDVVTPLVVGEGGIAVLVDRGWVPLDMDQVPVTSASPPPGQVTITGWLHPTQLKPALGPTDPPEGVLTTLSRVDVARIEAQVPFELENFYLVEMGERGDELPVTKSPPAFDDEGPHLSYAIQWFAFAVIGLIGYSVLIRRTINPRGPRD